MKLIKPILAAVFGMSLAWSAGAQSGIFQTLGPTAPVPGPNDIFQLSLSGNTTFPDGENYYTDNFSDHGLGEPGQTFTTGGNPAGYLLTSLSFAEAGLDDGGAGANTSSSARNYHLYIFSVAANGTATPIDTESTQGTPVAFNSGDWLQWTNLSVALSANSVYAYTFGKVASGADGGTGSSYDAMGVASGNPYPGGEIALILPTGGAISFTSSHSYDAAFVAGLTPLSTPVAPTITLNPTNVSSYGGRVVQLVAGATGTELSYQWQVNGVNLVDGGDISGSTSNILTFSSLSSADANTYTLNVSNSAGTATTGATVTWLDPSTAHFIWSAPAAITTADATLSQPGNVTGAATFGATAVTVTYTNSITGVTNATIAFTSDGSIATVSGGAAGTVTYTPTTTPTNANFSTAMGEASVNGGPKTISLFGLAPGRHYSVQLFALNDATGSAGAGANLAYYVDPNDGNDTSATIVMRQNVYIMATFYASNTTETITEVLPAAAAGDMNAVVIRLLDPQPAIVIQPIPQILFTNRNAHFSVTAAGAPTLGYTWQRNATNLINGGNISGATLATLTVSGVSAADVANYNVVVTNTSGSITSSIVALSLAAPLNTAYETAVRTNNPVVYFELNDLTDPLTNGPAYDYVGGLVGNYSSNAVNALSGIAGPQASDGLAGFANNNLAVETLHGLSGSYVSIPPMNLNTNAVTITAWIKPTGAEAANDGVVFCRGNGTTAGINYTGNTDVNGNYTLGYTWNNDPLSYNFDSRIVPPPGQWSFVALVVTPTNATIYILTQNGASASLLDAKNVIAHTNQTFAAVTRIGDDANSGAGARTFDGTIDDVAIFNQALTTLQLEHLYTAASGVANFPPSIGASPTSQGRYVGRSLTLSVASDGTAPLNFQWQQDTGSGFVNISDTANRIGTASNTLVLNNLTAGDTGNYQVVVTNPFGTATSASATVTVVTPVPGSYEASIVAAAPRAYWRFNETSGITAYDYYNGLNATYQAGALIGQPGVPNPPFTGFEASNDSMETLNATANSWATAPGVILNTNAVTFLAWVFPVANPGTFSGLYFNRNSGDVEGFGFGGTVNASGMPALGYTWNNNSSSAYNFNSGVFLPTNQWSLVALVVTPTNAVISMYNTNGHAVGTNFLTHNNAAFTGNGNNRICNDSGGSNRGFNGYIDEMAIFNYAMSNDQLTTLFTTGSAFEFAPTITTQPTSEILLPGADGIFTATAFGSLPLSYQWQINGAPIAGATSPTLNLGPVSQANVAGYSLVVANAGGSITSAVANLTLTTPSGGSFESAVIALQPVAYYELNETNGTTAFDYAGGFNGTYGSANLKGVPGVPNPPYTGFAANNTAVRSSNNVANSYVTIPALNLNTNNVTMTAWVFPTSFNGSAGFVFYRDAIGNDVDGIGYSGNANELGYTWNPNVSSTWGYSSKLIIPTNQWSFVALTVSPTNAILYLGNNGIFKSATNAILHVPGNFNTTARIGEDSSGNGRIFNGVIDDVAIFNQTLTGIQLLNLYATAGVPLQPPTLTIQESGTNAILNWSYGTLLSAPSVTGPYSFLSGTSPFTITNVSGGTQQFYRVLQVR